MSDSFEKAVEEAKVLPERPSNNDLSDLYGLYKQATVGDVQSECPGIIHFAARAKWCAWNEKKGLSKEDAMAAYVKVVEKLKADSKS
ncbi:acyl-CoA-binding protein-like isoform X2 [Nelusetta ayraudi]|uniref:acyl-CoA-binding protein-like isoform X2 n=1 Tax=Nelusetta ayraudi TaxID=303726 RepID=UPI003F71C410